jgi:HSP20 family protein
MTKAIDVAVERHPVNVQPPESYFVPLTDVYETKEELVLVADLPGVGAEGLDVTVEDAVLAIHGHLRETEKPAGKMLLQEFAVGPYYRSFQLPVDFDTEKIKASIKQGVLTLSLPKSERLKPRRIEVKAE